MKLGRSAAESLRLTADVYGDTVMSRARVFEWHQVPTISRRSRWPKLAFHFLVIDRRPWPYRRRLLPSLGWIVLIVHAAESTLPAYLWLHGGGTLTLFSADGTGRSYEGRRGCLLRYTFVRLKGTVSYFFTFFSKRHTCKPYTNSGVVEKKKEKSSRARGVRYYTCTDTSNTRFNAPDISFRNGGRNRFITSIL